MPAVLFCVIGVLFQPLADKVVRHIRDLLEKLPNYTCLETVEREARGGICRTCAYRDRTRLEVGIVDDREVYSWPGSGKLGEHEVEDLYRGGAVATGDFGGFASGVFSGRAPDLAYAGEEMLEGHRTFRFTYRIASEDSNYSVSVGRRSAVVGYSGSFWTDPESLDLMRLEARADALPRELALESVQTVVDYQRVRIGASEYLLPRETRFESVASSGLISRNVTRYSGCRQYVGESTIRFGEEPARDSAGARPASSAGPPTLPAGLEIDMALAEPIDFAAAAQGDAVVAVAAREVKRSGRVLIPKRARLHGRIAYFRTNLYPKKVTLIALAFREVETGGGRVPLSIALDSAPHLLSGPPASFGRVLAFPDNTSSVPAGFRMKWRTVP